MPFSRNRLMKQLTQHEGMKLKPYTDTVGKVTIGIGRNLDDVGISEGEAQLLLSNDVDDAFIAVAANVRGFKQLNGPRQEVVVNMAFNLGWPRLSGFKRFLAAIQRGNFEAAADEMLDSKWARQVGNRALVLADQMRTGYA